MKIPRLKQGKRTLVWKSRKEGLNRRLRKWICINVFGSNHAHTCQWTSKDAAKIRSETYTHHKLPGICPLQHMKYITL